MLVKCASGEGTGRVWPRTSQGRQTAWPTRNRAIGARTLGTRPFRGSGPRPSGQRRDGHCAESSGQQTGPVGWTGMGCSPPTLDPWTRGHAPAASTHVKARWPEGGGHTPRDATSSTGHQLHLRASQSCHPLRKAIGPPDPSTPSPGTETRCPALLPPKAGAGMFFNVDTEFLNYSYKGKF